MRALSVHPDLIVFISRVWQTTCTAVRSQDEGFVIDSPVYPDELDALPQVLEQAGFPVSGLLATHGDWDHLLGRLAFPQAALGCGESTAKRLHEESGAAQRALRAFDEEHYIDRQAPLGLGSVQSLPVPGKLDIGPDREIELHPTGGHTADGTAYLLAWLGTLICGDYLSPVEIPMISPGGSVDEYQGTLRRLEPLIERSATVIPGHGAPLERDQALRILREDQAYLESLPQAKLPEGRRTQRQRQIHAENVSRC